MRYNEDHKVESTWKHLETASAHKNVQMLEGMPLLCPLTLHLVCFNSLFTATQEQAVQSWTSPIFRYSRGRRLFVGRGQWPVYISSWLVYPCSVEGRLGDGQLPQQQPVFGDVTRWTHSGSHGLFSLQFAVFSLQSQSICSPPFGRTT